jgi:hypothetical protein
MPKKQKPKKRNKTAKYRAKLKRKHSKKKVRETGQKRRKVA